MGDTIDINSFVKVIGTNMVGIVKEKDRYVGGKSGFWVLTNRGSYIWASLNELMPLDPVLDYDILVKAGIRGEISPYGTFVGYLGGVPYPEPKPTETYETYEVTIKSAKLTAQQITELLNVLPKNTTIEIKKG